jgi:hypothetical protein
MERVLVRLPFANDATHPWAEMVHLVSTSSNVLIVVSAVIFVVITEAAPDRKSILIADEGISIVELLQSRLRFVYTWLRRSSQLDISRIQKHNQQ